MNSTSLDLRPDEIFYMILGLAMTAAIFWFNRHLFRRAQRGPGTSRLEAFYYVIAALTLSPDNTSTGPREFLLLVPSATDVIYNILLFVPLGIGLFAGEAVHTRVPARAFRALVFGLLAVAGLVLALRS